MVASDRLSRLRRRHGRADSRQGPSADADGAVLVRAPRRTSCRTTSPATIPEASSRPTSASRCAAARCWSSACKPLPIEAVVRGYLAGSGWKEYQAERRGVRRDAAAGPAERVKLPAADLHAGHQGRDGRPRREHRLRARGRDRRRRPRRRRCATPRSASTARRRRSRWPRASSSPTPSSSSASTTHGTLTLMDEVLTPDSSRFWPADEASPRAAIRRAYDKQFVRDWLEQRAHRRPALEQEGAGAGAARQGDRADGAATYRAVAASCSCPPEPANEPASEQRHAELAPVRHRPPGRRAPRPSCRRPRACPSGRRGLGGLAARGLPMISRMAT